MKRPGDLFGRVPGFPVCQVIPDFRVTRFVTLTQMDSAFSLAKKRSLTAASCFKAGRGSDIGRTSRQGVSPLYVDLEQVVPVIVGERCVPGVGILNPNRMPWEFSRTEILTCRDVVRNVRLRAPGIGGAFVDGCASRIFHAGSIFFRVCLKIPKPCFLLVIPSFPAEKASSHSKKWHLHEAILRFSEPAGTCTTQIPGGGFFSFRPRERSATCGTCQGVRAYGCQQSWGQHWRWRRRCGT